MGSGLCMSNWSQVLYPYQSQGLYAYFFLTHDLLIDKAVSDMDYFKNRVKKDWSDTYNEDEDDDGADAKGDMEVDNGDDDFKKSHQVHP